MIKKTITISFLAVLILGSVAPLVNAVSKPIFEEELPVNNNQNFNQNNEGVTITAEEVPSILEKIAKYFYNAVLIISVIFILVSAFYFLRGGDNPQYVAKAKKQLIYAIIGIAITLVSFGVKEFITALIRSGQGG